MLQVGDYVTNKFTDLGLGTVVDINDNEVTVVWNTDEGGTWTGTYCTHELEECDY